MDKIILEGMTFYGYHGYSVEEQTLGQRFVVDLEVELDLRSAGAGDDIAETVSYAHLYRLLREVVEGHPRKLLEAVAEVIAGRVLGEFGSVMAARVRVAKFAPPIEGAVVGGARVEIYRQRKSNPEHG
jgi:dihydroneopterin aldolase